MGRISHELCSRGLLTHELCRASRCCDILGIELDGERLHTRAASAKNEKLRLALQWVLEQRRVWGQKLERVMESVTYISLVRRPLLSAFAAVYPFQQAHYNEPTFLRASCRAELKHFLNEMPLLESNWGLPWSGGAVWNVHSMGQCFHREAIHLSEARAQVWGAIRCEEWYGPRCLTLMDNMSCVLALGRPRAGRFRLLLLVRRACAIGLACHCKQYFRWISSEGNPADAPSRVYDPGKVGDKSTGLFQYQHFSVNTGQKLHNESDQSMGRAQSVIHIDLRGSLLPWTACCQSCLPVRGHERVFARRLNETPAAQNCQVAALSRA